jgi:hypothetical protein
MEQAFLASLQAILVATLIHVVTSHYREKSGQQRRREAVLRLIKPGEKAIEMDSLTQPLR